MNDNLTRWLDLFEKDPSLRPVGLDYEGGWWLTNPEIILGGQAPIKKEQAEDMIVGRAVKWLNTKHEGLTLGDGHFDDKYSSPAGEWPFSGFSAQVWGPCIDEIRSGPNLVDALYEAVLVVFENAEKVHAPSGQDN